MEEEKNWKRKKNEELKNSKKRKNVVGEEGSKRLEGKKVGLEEKKD